MGWSERQLAMLGEMGVRVWQVPPAVPEASPLSPPPAPAAEARIEAAAPTPRPVPRPEATRPPVAPPLPAAAVSAVATLAWEPLREAVAACTACKLCEDRQQAVYGIGHERAHWMIVGEAPGEQEDREGEPFVGKPGELLDNMLRAVGLTRHDAPPEEQVYLTHAVKCRPSGNRGADTHEIVQCSAYLRRQIALVRPRVVLALGRMAVQSLLQSSEPLGRLRGRVHRCDEVPVVVTYPPSYLLRNPEDKARAWDDLCLARELLDTPS